ncbi:unnamed protein product, partial [Ceratitis capitata]
LANSYTAIANFERYYLNGWSDGWQTNLLMSTARREHNDGNACILLSNNYRAIALATTLLLSINAKFHCVCGRIRIVEEQQTYSEDYTYSYPVHVPHVLASRRQPQTYLFQSFFFSQLKKNQTVYEIC